MNAESIFNLFLTTLAPVAIMGWYIYRKDHYKPEPLKVLFISAFSGFLGGFLAYVLTKVGLYLPEIYRMHEPAFTSSALLNVMMTLGIGDLIILLLLVGTVLCNRFFDEQVDGIVYAVFIALGFILCQNIIYLLYRDRSIVEEDVQRAFFLIPIYFFYAIQLGYYVSRLCYHRPCKKWRRLSDLAYFLFYPFLWHVILVVILLASEVKLNAWIGFIIFLVLIIGCFRIMGYCIQQIENLLERDVQEERAP